MWTEERGPPPLGLCLVPALPRPVGSSMGQQSFATMNAATSGKLSTRTTGYHQKALAEIRNSLLPFANSGGDSNVGSSAASTISTLSTTSGVSSASGLSGFSATSGGNGLDKDLPNQLHAMGYTEVSVTVLFLFILRVLIPLKVLWDEYVLSDKLCKLSIRAQSQCHMCFCCHSPAHSFNSFAFIFPIFVFLSLIAALLSRPRAPARSRPPLRESQVRRGEGSAGSAIAGSVQSVQR